MRNIISHPYSRQISLRKQDEAAQNNGPLKKISTDIICTLGFFSLLLQCKQTSNWFTFICDEKGTG